MSKRLQKKITSELSLKKLKRDELRKILKVKGEESLKNFNEALDEAEVEGKVFLDDKGFYHIFDSSIKLIQGRVFITKDGIGHFKGKKDGNKVKFQINHDDLNGALNGDIVIISNKHQKKYDTKLGKVEKIIKRNETGELFQYLGEGLFKLYDGTSDVYFYKKASICHNLVPGSLVFVKLDKTPKFDNIYQGEITKVCGHVDDPDSLIYAIGYKYGFDYNFSKKVMNEAKSLPTKIGEKDLEDRVDLRDEMIFTIDGDNTKDIDDAISIKKQGDNYILKVHIADVSHYLKDKPHLLKEALNRGNSAYLADSVFPMLPHIISNGICSLNPNADRLTKTVEMIINKEGKIINSNIYKSVIKSRKQMTYDNVNKVLKGRKVESYSEFRDNLRLMNKVSNLLEKNRKQNGAITFSNREIKIITDIDGNVMYIGKVYHKEAERIIENFMIAANTTVTEHFGYLDSSPFIYRIHEMPDTKNLLASLERLEEEGINDKTISELKEVLEKKIDNKEFILKPKYIADLLNKIKDTPYYEEVSNTLLLSMKRAVYSSKNTGHFGLANDSYSHFTSPIRRMADLANHFIIDLLLEYYKAPNKKRSNEICKELNYITKKLSSICEHISSTERLADDAEKEASKIKRFEYFENNIDRYEGPVQARISKISKTGINAVLGIFDVFIPSYELQRLGFNYKRESRSYVGNHETFKLSDRVYLLDPELSKNITTIFYTNISKDEDSLLNHKEKTLRKKHKINTDE